MQKSFYYARRLRQMIQCKTVSVQGSYNDAEFAKLRAAVEELFPVFHQTAVRYIFSDDCWIYRLDGRDSTRNIMLMSHHDVVDADEKQWSQPPFAAVIKDSKLWGRGSVDTKTPLFAEFSALEELLCEGWEPPCNIWLGSSHNEELSGDGMPTALEWFREQGITFDLILDEGGAIVDPPVSGMLVDKCSMVAVHEKGRYNLTFSAGTEERHTGLTSGVKASPVERMAGFVGEVTEGEMFVRRLNPQVRAMFSHMAPYCRTPMRVVFSNLWLFGGAVRRAMPRLNPHAGSMIGSTCAVSQFQGDGTHCTASASFRAVDAEDMEKDLTALLATAREYGVEVTVEPGSEYHEPADMSHPAFTYTMDCIRQVFPQYPPVPFILPAGTDARTLTEICPCVLRFAPIRLSARQLKSVHSHNENIDLDAIKDAVTFYKRFLREYRVEAIA